MSHCIIDAHAHCGCLDRFPPQDLYDYIGCLRRSRITGAIMFSPVAEIYDRYVWDFQDSEEWRLRRRQSNEYLLEVGAPGFIVYPYFFIWNDFAVEQIQAAHKGIKWHRHPDEPVYQYENPACSAAIEEIRRRNMPVVLEEEFENTLFFLNELAPGIRMIIPHLGMLNGGYQSFRRQDIWAMPNVWADTALASPGDIKDYVSRYGSERLMFGSDFPFGDPDYELKKIFRIGLPQEHLDAIIGENAARLLADSNPPANGFASPVNTAFTS